MKKIKIAYIGGGSKMWARVFMNDLALCKDLCGDIALYDIDLPAACRNQKIGERINQLEGVTKWNYLVTPTIEECLKDATFVVLSILPGTFQEMNIDVHQPEKYGIYQTVGDTVGPGGVIRSMRTVPLYEYFAKKIEEVAPNAWVINFTNPMSICVKTLYDVFPKIKAFGCCHEVFHAQDFLAMVVEEIKGLSKRPNRHEIIIDVAGINHFTWITSAKYQNEEILPLVNEFAKVHFEEGIYEGENPQAFLTNTYAYGNKVKMDLYRRYGILGAAGDRHLVEFMNQNWYLKNPEEIKKWAISITPVSSRIADMKEKIALANKQAEGISPIVIKKSSEEAVEIMKALLGLGDLITNVNYPNLGQISDLPLGEIVESNAIFSSDKISTKNSAKLSAAVNNLVYHNCQNIATTYEGIKKRDLKIIFSAFVNQPLCANLTIQEAKNLFKEMVCGTRKYLDEFYNLDDELKNL